MGHHDAGLAATAGGMYRLIRSGAATTRSELGRRTGLSRTAVTARLNKLLDRGLVVEVADGASTGGRPPTRLRVNSDAGVVLAAALGASRAQLAVCDLHGVVRAHTELAVDSDAGLAALLASAVKSLNGLLADLGLPSSGVWGVGASAPGVIEAGSGRSRGPSVLPGWDEVSVAEVFTAEFGVPAQVDNDVNVLALAEHRRFAEVDDLLVVKASTGIGAGLISGGVLQRGARGAAGEIGHTKVAGAAGASCRCGETGCLESVAAGWALLRELAASGTRAPDTHALAELARDGDPDAVRLVRQAGRRIGEVLGGAVNLLNPELVVIGGDLAIAYDPLLAGLRETVYRQATAIATRDLRIEPADQDLQAGIAGSANLALAEVLSPRAVNRMLRGSA